MMYFGKGGIFRGSRGLAVERVRLAVEMGVVGSLIWEEEVENGFVSKLVRRFLRGRLG